MVSVVSRLIEIGTSGYDQRTARRLRLINGVALVSVSVVTMCLILIFLLLSNSNQNPFSAGNASLVILIVLYLPVFWLHRFGEDAAAYYLYSIISVFIFLSVLFQGRDQGGQYGLLLVAAAVPVIFSPRRSVRNAMLMLLAIGFAVLIEIVTPEVGLAIPNDRPPETNQIIKLLTIGLNAIILCFIVGYAFRIAERAEQALEAEHARSEALLYNLLPEEIAARLKVQPDQIIADSLPKVAILFADIVDFTPRAARLPPEEVVGFLNTIFSAFDELAEKHGLEKIKTVGDAYMVAAGMPSPVGDPVHRVAAMALDMRQAVDRLSAEFAEGLEVRIGLHAGPAVAGVIGNRKLFYDVWGETVNTASRMESHGEPGQILVTMSAKEELDDAYEFEPRGIVEVKGLGKVETWFLAGPNKVN